MKENIAARLDGLKKQLESRVRQCGAVQKAVVDAGPTAWAKHVQEGDILTVRQDFMTRGGQSGTVVSIDKDGCSIDFMCDVFGNPKGVPSIEFWEWRELEPRHDLEAVRAAEQRRGEDDSPSLM